NHECQGFIKTITGSARQMNQLIDDLLAFSRMSRTEICHVTIDMGSLVETAKNEVARGLAGRRVVWSIGALPRIQGDPVTLRQVLLNLISNALKYTRPRAEARIEIGALDKPLETVFF